MKIALIISLLALEACATPPEALPEDFNADFAF